MVVLRSEPQRSQNEILALLVTGHAGSDVGAPPEEQAGAGGAAASVAANVFTTGLNQVLTGVTNLGIQTKIDTSQAQNPRPEIEVQVSRDVYIAIAYNVGLPPPGENPDRTLVMLNYRFARNWSVQTTVGDEGSSILDLLWKYRY
jgi:translocation and assembly module TamB